MELGSSNIATTDHGGEGDTSIVRGADDVGWLTRGRVVAVNKVEIAVVRDISK